MKIPNSKFLQKPTLIPPLDPGFRPAVLSTRAFQRTVTNAGGGVPLILGLERSDGAISRFETQVLPGDHPDADNNLFYCERILKFILWQRGGWKIFVGGPKIIGDSIKRIYSPEGEQAFDFHFMGEDVYLREFTVITCEPNEVPPARESERSIGRHFDGCRIGFDLGASDLKVAALIDGEPIFSKEIEWNPKDQTNPNYHKANIMVALEI
ncbi:MAG: ROK family protein, partial [Anaerolineales bacterium]